MNSRFTKGAALFALIVPLVALTQYPAQAGSAGDHPTYTTYTVGSADLISGEDDEHAARCNGPNDSSRDTAVGVDEALFPNVPADFGQVIHHLGRVIGFQASTNFNLICHDDHPEGIDLD